MDFIGGALPNTMLLIGVIAIGIGLGLEFKIVEVKGQLSRGGRIGVITTGVLLIGASIFLYTRPPNTTAIAPAAAPTTAATATLPATAPAAATVVQIDILTVAPSTSAPLDAATPTQLAPTQAVPASAAPATTGGVPVPDIRGQSLDDARKTLVAKGLQLGERKEDCDDVGERQDKGKPKKEAILCQSPAPETPVAPGSAITYVITDDKSKD